MTRPSTLLLLRVIDELTMTPDGMAAACGVDRTTFDGYFAKPETMPVSSRLALAALLKHLAGDDGNRAVLAAALAAATESEIEAAGVALRREIVGLPLDEVRRRVNAHFASSSPPGDPVTAADIAKKRDITEEAFLVLLSAPEA